MQTFLSDDFLCQYEDKRPENEGILFDVIRLRYARTIIDKVTNRKRLEKWFETCARTVEYSFSLYSGDKSKQQLIPEAEEMFDLMFHLYSFPAGRTMKMGGSLAGELNAESMFNCAFTTIEDLEDFCEVFHLSLCSCGVGFGIEDEMIDKLPQLKTDVRVEHKDYIYIGYTNSATEHTLLNNIAPGEWLIKVGDSKNGWVQALRYFFNLISEVDTYCRRIVFDYDWVRPEGQELKTWGGKSAGHEGLQKMFEKLSLRVLSSNGKLKALDALDTNTIIGKNVVSGGTRRAAMIGLFSPSNKECVDAKKGNALGWYAYSNSNGKEVDYSDYMTNSKFDSMKWNNDKYEGIIDWFPNPETENRTMSNNSIVFDSKPSFSELQSIFKNIKENGEPGFFNRESARKRRNNVWGLNPCGEILLNNKGVCNLTTNNIVAHIQSDSDGNLSLNWTKLEKSVRNAVRIGCRQTNVTLSLPKWDEIQKRERLLGVSMTGEMDALDLLGWRTNGKEHVDFLKRLRFIANDEADKYAYELRIPRPLLVTTVKPEGSLSLLPTVSWGMHRSFAPFYIRRIKFANFEPTCKALMQLGVPWEKDKTKKESNRIVFSFPVKTEAPCRAYDEPIEDQIGRYLVHQKYYTDHNTSCTLYVGSDEWEKACKLVYENWDDITAVSFLAKSNNVYVQAPNEWITEGQYKELVANFPDLADLSKIIDELEHGKHEEYEIIDSSCEGGACPIV